jgi:hypothetical protein
MKLTTRQRDALFRATRGELNRVIDIIRRENPDAFHNSHTLADRVFYHEPLHNERCRNFVKPHMASTLDQ